MEETLKSIDEFVAKIIQWIKKSPVKVALIGILIYWLKNRSKD